jgi:hypothetical protein
MKKRLLAFSFVFFSLALHAQTLQSPHRISWVRARYPILYPPLPRPGILPIRRPAISPAGQMQSYGTTYENRPLLVAVVASEENFPRLEEIRTNHLKSIGLQEGTPTGKTVPFAWMSYNIHGNENVSSEASMIVLYELLKGRATGTLKNTVVLIDPCANTRRVRPVRQWLQSAPGQYPEPLPQRLGAQRGLARRAHEPLPLRPQPRLGLARAAGKPGAQQALSAVDAAYFCRLPRAGH